MQDEWIADWEREHDKRVEYDPDVVWYPHRVVNYREMAQAWAEREYDAAHEKKPWHDGTWSSWAKKQDEQHPHHYRDGTAYVVTQDEPESDEWF